MYKNRTSGSVPVVHCNNVIEVSEKEFGQLIKDGKVHHLEGKLDEQSPPSGTAPWPLRCARGYSRHQARMKQGCSKDDGGK